MKRVVLGMSGGVDSSVAAYVLKEKGYEVIGLFMKNWEDDDENGMCTSEEDYADVRRVANLLNLPYFTKNFSKEYKEKVFSEFISEYECGHTPNPDVLCNREIKFGPFLDEAMKMDADYIATGHYCDIEEKEGFYYLKNCADSNKDQTYFLCLLNQKQLSKVIFPLADIKKEEVREIAKKLDLSTAEKKDSTGVCFIGERNFREFLKNYLPMTAGDIVNEEGRVVGKHDGLLYYTLGQRKGLNIGGMKGIRGGSWFVIKKDLAKNELIVSQDENKLLSDSCDVVNINWIPFPPKEGDFECEAKFRYRQPNQKVKLILSEDKSSAKVIFENAQRAITPGQYAVFYKDGYCLGGGMINDQKK